MSKEMIAVVDVETNFNDGVISIGIAIAEADTYDPVKTIYHVITPECNEPSMFEHVLDHRRAKATTIVSRMESIQMIENELKAYGVKKLFAYNAVFDKRHLPELGHYMWFDIMGIAAYKQYNKHIPPYVECCGSGRIKRGYKAEDIYRMLSGDRWYSEVHNALADAMDELKIMQMLGHEVPVYENARMR